MAIPQQASILHRWKLDEISGNRADSVGTYTLTDNATVGYSDSAKQGYYSADFESDNSEYLSRANADSTDMDFTDGDFTISMWYKIESTDATQVLIMRGTWTGEGWYIYYSSSGNRLYLYTIKAGPTVQAVASNLGPVTIGTFAHFVIVNDRTNTVGYIYKNGSDITGSSSTLADILTSTENLTIGCTTDRFYYLDGLLDDIIIWDVALSSTEVTALYNTYPISAEKKIPCLTSRSSAMYKQLE